MGITRMKTAKSPTFFCDQVIIEVCPEQLDLLKKEAAKSPLKRARLCLHHDHEDKVQEMVIVFTKDSFTRPHRHLNKSESFHIIEGNLLVVFFNEEGSITQEIKMGPYGSNQTFCYRLSKSLWHTVIPLSEFVVIHEVTTGPFIKEEAKFPVWAPKDTEINGIKIFLSKIRP